MSPRNGRARPPPPPPPKPPAAAGAGAAVGESRGLEQVPRLLRRVAELAQQRQRVEHAAALAQALAHVRPRARDDVRRPRERARGRRGAAPFAARSPFVAGRPPEEGEARGGVCGRVPAAEKVGDRDLPHPSPSSLGSPQ